MTRNATCNQCGEAFEVDKIKGRLPVRCESCEKRYHRERQYRWREANPERWKAVTDRANTKRLADPEFRKTKREAAILRTYGISADELARRAAEQDGQCAICRKPPRGKPNGRARPDHVPNLHVDHDHATGAVRGLLCGNCNTMIGLAGEDPAVLLAAVKYLQKE